jgi:PKD repeat protein
MTFVGILAFNLPNIAMSSDFSCPVNANVSNFTCSGTVKVKTLAELNAYRNDLGVVAKKPTIAKNLLIDFNPAFTSDLVISTPCSIKVPTNIVMTSIANVCLHGTKGVSIDENFKFTGKNLKLESKEEVIINKNSVIKAQDIKLLSIGSGDTSKTYIREAANIEAANLSIESFDKGFIGINSIVKLTGALGIYSLGDDEASVREGARVEAAKIEISSTEETRIAKSTTLVASEIILNGIKCTINKTAVITADNRLGNCFLISTTNKAKFSINKNQGTNPLTVIFDASSIADAKGFIWSFGDGETLNSLTPNVTHVYNRVGSFTATLKYAIKDNYKGLKSAGAIQIDVKEAPISNPVIPVPPRGNLKYQADGTFVYLRGYIRKGTYDIANAYYVIDNNQDNKIQIPNFYQNSLTSVEMNTYGRHKVTMNVIDVQGLTHSKSMNIYTTENESNIYPYMRLDYDQSAPKTIFFDLSWSFNPIVGETLKDFTIDFGDGQSAVLTNTAFITHTYAQAGTYLVKAIGKINGNEDFDEYEIEVTDENTPIMNPIAGFEYQIYDYAGNVMFTNDRSGTPNGEIISYAWDFGDGTVGYGKNASNFYAPGDYLVTLTVTDTAGLRSSQTQKITIVAEGDDIASMLDCWSDRSKHLGCEVVAFDKFNEINRVKLDWGDGTSEILTVPDFASTGFSIREHNYENYGTYNINLTIDTSRGQTKNLFHAVAYTPPIDPPIDPPVDPIYYPPVADIQCAVNNMLVTCNALGSYDPQNLSLEYVFNYYDGFVEQNGNGFSSHAYTQAGFYNIQVTVKNSKNLQSTKLFGVLVVNVPANQLPITQLSCSPKGPHSVECLSSSYDSDGYISSQVIDWGDGTSSTSSNDTLSTHIYSSSGNVNIALTAIDNDGGVSSITTSLEVKSNHAPFAFIQCSSREPFIVECYSNSIDEDPYDAIIEYKWEMGDGSILTTIVPYIKYNYNEAKEYSIKLIVKDTMGQAAEVSQITEVLNNKVPVASIECHISSNNSGHYECNSSASDIDGFITSIEWIIEGKSFIGNQVSYDFQNGGNKNIILKVTDNLGAVTSVVKVVNVDLPTFECRVVEELKYRCSLLTSKVGKKIIFYRFDFNNNDFEEGNNVEYEFNSFGNQEIELTLIYEDQSIVTASLNINIASKSLFPKADFGPLYDSNKHVQFNGIKSTATERRVVNYIWNYGDGNIETTVNPYSGHTYLINGLYKVKLTVVDQAGHSNFVEKEIYVHDPEVEDPGEEGRKTILGVDSDNDGIRDDIQRWINYDSKGSEQVRGMLRKIAKNWQDNIVDVDDKIKSRKLIEDRFQLEACLRGVVYDEERSEHLLSFMEYIVFYTPERFLIRQKNEVNYAGLVQEVTNDHEQLLASCEGI